MGVRNVSLTWFLSSFHLVFLLVLFSESIGFLALSLNCQNVLRERAVRLFCEKINYICPIWLHILYLVPQSWRRLILTQTNSQLISLCLLMSTFLFVLTLIFVDQNKSWVDYLYTRLRLSVIVVCVCVCVFVYMCAYVLSV